MSIIFQGDERVKYETCLMLTLQKRGHLPYDTQSFYFTI